MLFQRNATEARCSKASGRIRCSVLLSPRSEVNNGSSNERQKSGALRISPAREGPWTILRLNYAAPAACWQFGNNIVASEVSVCDGNRYVNIRSLVSVRNDTDAPLDLQLKLRASEQKTSGIDNGTVVIPNESCQIVTDEFFETEKYNPAIGWVGCGESLEVGIF